VEIPDSPQNTSSGSTSPLPTQTYHSPILSSSILIPALVESAAGGAHYAGVKVDGGSAMRHRRSSSQQHYINHEHRRVLGDLTELYCCRPTLEIFERSWSSEAEFENPFAKCKGYREYAAQWFALPKLFFHSEQISKRIMSSTDHPNRIIYYQEQEYTFRLLIRKKVIKSIIVVDLDENDKVIRLVDQWDGADLPTRFGASLLRTLNAKVAPWLIYVPKA